MIIRVWGSINDLEVEFSPIPHRPGYWEGYGPRVPGLQYIKIYAENDRGGIAHLDGTVMMHWVSETLARLTLHPYSANLVESRKANLLTRSITAKYLYDKEVS